MTTMSDGGHKSGGTERVWSGIPEDTSQESPKNNSGHLSLAHSHLMNLHPEGLSERDWSRLVVAYELVRSVREENGAEPNLMEKYDDRGPRRYRCDGCGSVFLTRNDLADADDLMITSSPDTCPFCIHGKEIEEIEGWYVQPASDRSTEQER
jgi:hypothetical protein